MAGDEHDLQRRTTPPTKEEWPRVWDAVEKAHKGWPIISPFHAVVTNWRALLIVAVVVLWINNPKLLAFLESITGNGG
jgi:hypothetical protein